MLTLVYRIARFAAILAFLAGRPAWAHPQDVTVTDLYLGTQRVELAYTVPTGELWRVVGGEKPEVTPPATHYERFVRDGFALENSGTPCSLSGTDARTLSEIDSYQFRLRYDCPRPLERLRLRYDLFVDFDRAHLNLVRFIVGEIGRQDRLHHGRRSLEVSVTRLRAEQGIELSRLPERPEPPTDSTTATTGFLALFNLAAIAGLVAVLLLASLLLWRLARYRS